MNSRIIPERALMAQAQAADPERSVWVSANAGSGKTHVLTERVIRLLMAGTPPARILCLTYTKAAAAVMQARIFDRLSQWTSMDDENLGRALKKLENSQPSPERLKQARRLFAHALETPGGLKIQTIHAFCEALLHQFPLEANIAGHFELMDDRMAQAMMDETRRALIIRAYQGEDEKLNRAFSILIETVGETGLTALFDAAVANRQALKKFLAACSNRVDTLRTLFGLGDSVDRQSLIGSIQTEALLSADQCALFMTHGGAKSRELVALLDSVKNAQDNDMIIALAQKAYFTAAGERRGLAQIVPKALREAFPDASVLLEEKQQRLETLFDQLKTIELITLNDHAYTLIDNLLFHYEQQKKYKGLLDFDDLIYSTLRLLKRRGAGQWVQYKLDRGIDHILVDEAQDTSPAQWEIVQLLSGEFFVGSGQRDVERTVFAVGDEKQSIYSFQGAAPEDFAANGRAIRKRVDAAGRIFSNIRLDFSFRSTHEVLSAVDQVFSCEENYKGLSAEPEKTVHEAIRKNEPGEVDIWEAFSPEIVEEPEDWRVPVDQLRAPAVRLAETIAATIAGWLEKGEPLPGQNRCMRAGDIMILVRKRDQFVPALNRALKNRGIPVAGADRLQLTRHIAVRDLMALGQFVLQPQDDLALAGLFKSPLFDLTEDDLFKLAYKRNGTLWQSVQAAALKGETAYQSFVDCLTHYRKIADQMPVFEFYSNILSADGGRQKFLARLGSEASDVLDAFLDYTLSVQQNGLPGLQNFLQVLQSENPEIKRELDQNREEVRIMTVHAAKGLEGAVVFLVDSGSRIWNSQHEPKMVMIGASSQAVPVWIPNSRLKVQKCALVIDALKERAQEEYRRLLYVGMTRAEDRLIVCGYRGQRPQEETWAPMVRTALEPILQDAVSPDPAIAAWRYQRADMPPFKDEMAVVEKSAAFSSLPDYFLHPMQREDALPRPLNPSKTSVSIEADAEEITDRLLISPVLYDVAPASSKAMEKGNVIHALLQYLPDIAPDQRRVRLRQYVGQVWPHADIAVIDDIENHVMRLLDDEQLQPLFVDGARAEVSIMGVIDWAGRKIPVSGQIDRLGVTDDRLIIADFKTGYMPNNKNEVPFVYRAQLALYAALLKPLYPDKHIEAMLIYSRGPRFFCYDDAALQTELDQLALPIGRS